MQNFDGERNFGELLEAQFKNGKHVCVGLDTDFDLIPESVKLRIRDRGGKVSDVVSEFNREIIKATGDLVAAYKPNIAFYEAMGKEGARALRDTVAFIISSPDYRHIPVILDAKRADIGKTNKAYAKAAFDINSADALTINPYLGEEAMKPFLDKRQKGMFVLCKTSNSGGGEFQDLKIDGSPLYVHVAKNVSDNWNKNENCGLVVGATWAEQLALVREVAPKLWILAPGVGDQGGDLQKLLEVEAKYGPNKLIVNSSGGVIYASNGHDYAEKAREAVLKLDKHIRGK